MVFYAMYKAFRTICYFHSYSGPNIYFISHEKYAWSSIKIKKGFHVNFNSWKYQECDIKIKCFLITGKRRIFGIWITKEECYL